MRDQQAPLLFVDTHLLCWWYATVKVDKRRTGNAPFAVATRASGNRERLPNQLDRASHC